MVRRTGLDMNIDDLEKNFKISPETLLSYDATAYRSILTYAAEEALLTESKEIQPQHLFLAITRINPYLQK
jgi:hypothetical protein